MHSISGLCVLAVLTTLAQSRADLDWSSNEVEGSTADPLLFSPDNLSSLQSLTDDNVVGDNFALTDSPTDDYTASLFADSLGECSFGGSSQPSRKLRARDNPSCSTKSSTNSPPVQLPDLGDIENIADPATRPSVPGKVRSNALDYYNVCPAGSKSFPDWVICGIKSFSNGLATWQNDVIDADIYFFGATSCESPRAIWCCEKYNADARKGSFCQLYAELLQGPYHDGIWKL